LHERVGQRFEAEWIVIALGFEIVGQFASRKIGIAVADQDEISIERPYGRDAGVSTVVRNL